MDHELMTLQILHDFYRNGHLSIVQHRFELPSSGIAQAMQISMREQISGH